MNIYLEANQRPATLDRAVLVVDGLELVLVVDDLLLDAVEVILNFVATGLFVVLRATHGAQRELDQLRQSTTAKHAFRHTTGCFDGPFGNSFFNFLKKKKRKVKFESE